MVFEMAEKGIREVRIKEYAEKLPSELAWDRHTLLTYMAILPPEACSRGVVARNT